MAKAIKRATSVQLRPLKWLSASSLKSPQNGLSTLSKALAQAASERTLMLKPSVMSDLRNLDFPFMSAISPRPKPSTSLRSEFSLTTIPAAGDPAAVAGDVCDRRTVFQSEWKHYRNQASAGNFHHKHMPTRGGYCPPKQRHQLPVFQNENMHVTATRKNCHAAIVVIKRP